MTKRINIRGVVQGVGFRPFVFNLARKHGVRGFCLNDSEGVVIEAEGGDLEKFIEEIKGNPPPLARIEDLSVVELEGSASFKDFRIEESVREEGRSGLISPDISICGDCLAELFTPSDRRHLYPFINCTNCGPRYSIVTDIPYDRASTTMAGFAMCGECEREYHDPGDRRFHAQPNACPACGPMVWLSGKGSVEAMGPERNFSAIRKVQGFLKEGAIVAVKGLGGFHLACDAENHEAVERLRERKRKNRKPFALMAPDVETIRAFAEVGEEEKRLLEGRVRPIVLLRKKAPGSISGAVSPDNRDFGLMLPYTPLHFLLFHGADIPALVMTSGNLSEEPIVTSNAEAVSKLAPLADFFLLHNRDIYMRVDDSIARVERAPRVLRRSRGFVPDVVPLGEDGEEVLAVGAELKNTFCITKGKNAILSQHIGDLENLEALAFFKETLGNLKNTFRADPCYIAHDLHPDYLSTRFAQAYRSERGIPEENVIAVQHHHAHVVGCMAEHGLRECIGVAFDGAGLGTDGNIWGGEFLLARRSCFERAAHLSYVPMPGGDRAAREPWRMAVSHILAAYGDEAGPVTRRVLGRLDARRVEAAMGMIKGRINSPLTSSAGRLFDAVSSILGVTDTATFEGEAAIALEHSADPEGGEPYELSFNMEEPVGIDTSPIIRGVVEDLLGGRSRGEISRRFHLTIAHVIVGGAKIIRERTGCWDAALSGGVFQNTLVLEAAIDGLEREGFKAYCNTRVPPNDGGVSLGQAVAAREAVKGLKQKGEGICASAFRGR